MENLFVEDAPLEVDLEALLGITSKEIDEDSSTEVVILNEDNIEVSEPHIKIPAKRMEDVLKISAVLASSGMGSLDSKCVCMEIEKGKVKFLLTDAFMISIEKEVELLNTDNQFTGTLVFGTGVLARVLKVCSSVFTMIERTSDDGKKSYVLKVLGGELPVDNINNVNLGVYKKSYTDTSFSEYNKEAMNSTLKRMFSYASSAIKDNRVINFSGNVVQASPQGSAVRCEMRESYPSFGMKVPVARLLHILSSGDVGDVININSNGNVYKGTTYSMVVSNVDTNVCAYDSIIDRMFLGEGCVVDAPHLTKIADLSCGLDYSSGVLKFNYTDTGMVSCELLTKRKNSTLELRGTPNPDVVPMEKSIEVSSVNLRNVLSVYPQDSIVIIRVSVDGVSLESGNVRSVVLGKGLGK